jgi:hypothetical protein
MDDATIENLMHHLFYGGANFLRGYLIISKSPLDWGTTGTREWLVMSEMGLFRNLSKLVDGALGHNVDGCDVGIFESCVTIK